MVDARRKRLKRAKPFLAQSGKPNDCLANLAARRACTRVPSSGTSMNGDLLSLSRYSFFKGWCSAARRIGGPSPGTNREIVEFPGHNVSLVGLPDV